jgi:hypothetical protein
MTLLSEYNIIPIGDHCAISLILNELLVRKKSYPFDWVVHKDQLNNTNIIHNVDLISKLKSDSVENIVRHFIGDSLESGEKVNSNTSTWFAHDTEDTTEILHKYTRRFTRLNEDLHRKNIFIMVTRCYYLEESVFTSIAEIVLDTNKNSKILFISGVNHPYLEDTKYNSIIFKHIPYDISNAFNEDYTSFRPKIQAYLTELLL